MTMKREQHKYVTEKFSNLGKILLGMEGGGGRAQLRKLRGEAARKRQSVTAQETVRQRTCTGEIEPFRERQAKK